MWKLLFFIVPLISGCGNSYKTAYECPTPEKIVKVPEIMKVESRCESLKDIDCTRNPFVSLEKQGLQISEELEEITQPILSGIIYAPGRKLAIIEGQILGVGNMVDAKKIIEIRPESIVLKEAGKLYFLKLTDVVGFRKEEIKTTAGDKVVSKNKDGENISQENVLSGQ